MLTLFDTLLESKEKKKEILVVLYDLSSAFDTVSHEILLTKLQLYGLNKHVVKWVKSYLEHRKQIVTVCGQMSSTVKPRNLLILGPSKIVPQIEISADCECYCM